MGGKGTFQIRSRANLIFIVFELSCSISFVHFPFLSTVAANAEVITERCFCLRTGYWIVMQEQLLDKRNWKCIPWVISNTRKNWTEICKIADSQRNTTVHGLIQPDVHAQSRLSAPPNELLWRTGWLQGKRWQIRWHYGNRNVSPWKFWPWWAAGSEHFRRKCFHRVDGRTNWCSLPRDLTWSQGASVELNALCKKGLECLSASGLNVSP